MSSTAKRDPDHPRLGAFITMLVGIVLFFGMVSRIHDLPGARPRDQAIKDEDQVLKQQLAEERQRALAIFGRRDPVADFERINRDMEQIPGMGDVSGGGIDSDSTSSDEPDVPETGPRPDSREEPERPERPDRPTRPQPQQRYHVVKPGETLWGIAQTVYGDGNLYRNLIDANPSVRPETLRPGAVLKVPSLTLPAMRNTGGVHTP